MKEVSEFSPMRATGKQRPIDIVLATERHNAISQGDAKSTEVGK